MDVRKNYLIVIMIVDCWLLISEIFFIEISKFDGIILGIVWVGIKGLNFWVILEKKIIWVVSFVGLVLMLFRNWWGEVICVLYLKVD